MAKITFELPQPEFRQLRHSAAVNLRTPEAQARHILRRALGFDQDINTATRDNAGATPTTECTGTQPDPTQYGFDGLYAMLEECQDTMLKLGTAANEYKRALSTQHDIYYRELTARDARIAELESQLATSEELAEQHLAEIDSLERQLRDTEIGVRNLVGLQP